MAALHLLFNAVTVIFIAATMFAAGLGSTLAALRAAFTNVSLLLLVLLANLVVVPLLGWGLAALFHLTTAPFIALILTASSPGGPFGAKLGMVQHGDITTGAAMQVLLAAVGSITFAIGLLLRHYTTDTAVAWHPAAVKVSNVTFLIVLAGMLLGNWSDVVALLGSRALLAGFLFSALGFGFGTLLATGSPARRTTMGAVTAVRNAGPALAAIGIAFDNQPAILGALAAVLLSGLCAAIPIAAALGRRRTDPRA